MMKTIKEGNLTFSFPDSWDVSKFDAWTYYTRNFQSVCGGCKAVDFVAITPQPQLWLIEVKDYRKHLRTKSIDIADEIAAKVRDTLAGLFSARVNAVVPGEKAAAQQASQASKIHVILHLEQPKKHSKMFPRPFDPANILQKLKQKLKPVDPHPKVHEKSKGPVYWTVT